MTLKELPQRFLKSDRSFYSALLIIFFCLWCYAMRTFLSGQISLTYDAVVYFEHIRFFLDQIVRGQFPLWDPTRDGGVPNEFFLRRIGEFNPFYSVIVFLRVVGISFEQAYLIFLALYFWLGMIGFYFLSKTILKDKSWAFLAYVIFMFSSFGTTIVKSFMIFLFVPIVWFFYFLISFINKPQKVSLLGLSFCLMIILTTYIPFYFLTIFLSFVLVYVVINGNGAIKVLSKAVEFLSRYKVFALFCLLIVGLSCLPGFLFNREFRSDELIISMRQSGASLLDPLSVPKQSLLMGGIPASSIVSRLFSDLSEFQSGRFYIPLFGYLLILLGLVVRFNKTLFILFVWGLFNYLVSLYDATPLYSFLYDHIFFFKYLRNFQFFLWLVVLPAIILIIVIQWKSFYDDFKNEVGRFRRIFFIVAMHLALVLFFKTQHNVLSVSYWVVGISCFLFIGFEFLNRQKFVSIFLVVFAALIVLEPMNVFSYMKNNEPPKVAFYLYGESFLKPKFMNQDEVTLAYQRASVLAQDLNNLVKPQSKDIFYINSKAAIELRKSLDFKVLENLPIAIVYRGAEKMDSQKIDYLRIAKSLLVQDNQAYVFGQLPTNQKAVGDNTVAEIVGKDSDSVQILSYDVNQVKIKTNFPKERFLVYFDHYNARWRAFVDAVNQTSVYQANVAFKGVYVPKGEHIVTFDYGLPAQYALKYFLLFLFYSVFGGLVYLAVKVKL